MQDTAFSCPVWSCSAIRCKTLLWLWRQNGLIQHVSRRSLATLLLLGGLVGCSNSGPDKAEALDLIRQKLMQTITVGQERIDNLTYREGKSLGGGRFAVMVDYDITSLAPTMGLFNTINRAGSAQHIERERYVFVSSSTGWVLE